jgi:AcrR family transcriptional regulator
MENAKEDLRVRRTKKLLLDSLISLITERGFDAVTVKEITERAMVNRATFYRHYEDKTDLLQRGIEARIDDLRGIGDPPNPDPAGAIEDGPPRALVAMFEHVAENRDFYMAMLGIPDFVNRLNIHAEQIIRSRIEFMVFQSDTPPRVPVEVAIQYAVASYTGTVSWWLQNGTPYSPEEMARHYVSLNVLGLYGCL